MKKILISDYDQTFYINDEDIELNKIAVEKFRKDGNIFVFATGRSYEEFKNKVNEYDLKYDYAILNHGATILNSNDEVIENFAIANSIIPNIKEDILNTKFIKYFCCSLFESRVDFNYQDLTKIYAKYDNKELAMKVNEIINCKYGNYINSYYVTKNSIEIISNKTNKFYAIELLTKRLDIFRDNIYTIGDGYSDIEMIRNYKGYCMKDSVEELLDYCKDKKVESVSELIRKIYNIK